MNIVLYTPGTHKNRLYKAIEDDFIKKIQRFTSFSIIELEEPDNIGKLPISEQIKKTEEIILKKISDRNFVILLDSKGKEYTSEEFAEQLSVWLQTSKKNLVFVIGGPHGFSNTFKNKFISVSLSKMTFNHLIVRIIFLEQIFRSFCIIKNITYHY